jgi:hypothetical protein
MSAVTQTGLDGKNGPAGVPTGDIDGGDGTAGGSAVADNLFCQ